MRSSKIPIYLLVFKDIRLCGFWLTRYLATARREDSLKLYGQRVDLIDRGNLVGQIDSVFPINEIQAAVRRAGEGQRRGKVLLRLQSG